MIYLYFFKNSISSVDLYADDTSIYDINSDKKTLELNLQNALDLIRNWCLENGMLINTEKTKLMLITRRHERTILSDDTPKLTYSKLDLHISTRTFNGLSIFNIFLIRFHHTRSSYLKFGRILVYNTDCCFIIHT